VSFATVMLSVCVVTPHPGVRELLEEQAVKPTRAQMPRRTRDDFTLRRIASRAFVGRA
jgi:hypothetical protein